MKAFLEVIKLNVADVVTASAEICGEYNPVIGGECTLPGIDDLV